jgi:hypothetical protein
MFPLKLEVLFPTLDMAKAMARKLNGHRKVPIDHPADPRDIHRMRTELRIARETVKAQTMPRRPWIV